MKKQAGFTLIELVLFIMIIGILASTILLTLRTTLKATPAQHNNYIALQSARACLDGMLGEKALFGVAFFPCPSTTVPGNCLAPTGYSLGVNFVCTTLNSDTTYKTITVTVTGIGNATLTALVATY
jgi:prepilin-type N-terminal cleavage/methylation domain-containing protein